VTSSHAQGRFRCAAMRFVIEVDTAQNEAPNFDAIVLCR
jgi:hypothetical protein